MVDWESIVGSQLIEERVADGPVAIGIEMNPIVGQLRTVGSSIRARRFKQIDEGHLGFDRHISHGFACRP